jgi:TolB-like protein
VSLFRELKRRNIFKVAAAYIIVGWLLLQVSDVLVPALYLPDWFHSGIAFLLILGFPVAMIFAWAFELTPEGLKRDHEVDRSQSITQQTSRKLDFIIIGLLIAALGYFAWDKFVLAPERKTELVEATTAVVEQTAEIDKSIAVLPFVNMSSDTEQEYFSDGLTEEVLNLLAKIPNLRVIARTSSFAYKGKDVKIAEVANELHVGHVLEGSVRKAGNQLRITAQLIRASDSSHLWSETYDRTLENIFAIQDEIAAAVVSQLKLELLGETLGSKQVDPAAYALFLQAQQVRRQYTADSRYAANTRPKRTSRLSNYTGERWRSSPTMQRPGLA